MIKAEPNIFGGANKMVDVSLQLTGEHFGPPFSTSLLYINSNLNKSNFDRYSPKNIVYQAFNKVDESTA